MFALLTEPNLEAVTRPIRCLCHKRHSDCNLLTPQGTELHAHQQLIKYSDTFQA